MPKSPCRPACLRPAAIGEGDLFDAVSEEEARLNQAARDAAGGSGGNADFGAKVRR